MCVWAFGVCACVHFMYVHASVCPGAEIWLKDIWCNEAKVIYTCRMLHFPSTYVHTHTLKSGTVTGSLYFHCLPIKSKWNHTLPQPKPGKNKLVQVSKVYIWWWDYRLFTKTLPWHVKDVSQLRMRQEYNLSGAQAQCENRQPPERCDAR